MNQRNHSNRKKKIVGDTLVQGDPTKTQMPAESINPTKMEESQAGEPTKPSKPAKNQASDSLAQGDPTIEQLKLLFPEIKISEVSPGYDEKTNKNITRFAPKVNEIAKTNGDTIEKILSEYTKYIVN